MNFRGQNLIVEPLQLNFESHERIVDSVVAASVRRLRENFDVIRFRRLLVFTVSDAVAIEMDRIFDEFLRSKTETAHVFVEGIVLLKFKRFERLIFRFSDFNL